MNQSVNAETRVRGSVFIANLQPATSQDRAEEILKNTRQKYYDATHNCFAYRIDRNRYRFSDDGEPSGTAGKPVLARIDKYHLQRVILIVTRYFGGTKLGTGGLIRAYGYAAEAAINQAQIERCFNYQTLGVEYPFELVDKVQRLAQRFQARVREGSNEQGMRCEIEVFPSREAAFRRELVSLSRGRIKIISPE